MWNVPNAVTVARLVLSVVLFVLMAMDHFAASLAVFLIAAGTDWVDGYWARKYGQITQLGRILDPFADKMIICGAFIFLAAAPQLADGSPASGIAAWVAVLVMAREMIVTALRSFVGTAAATSPPSGSASGRWCSSARPRRSASASSCGTTRRRTRWSTLPAWVTWGLDVSLWTAIVLTIWSGVGYIVSATRVLKA